MSQPCGRRHVAPFRGSRQNEAGKAGESVHGTACVRRVTTAGPVRASEDQSPAVCPRANRCEGAGIMLVALDAGEAVAVGQRVAVGAEWDDALIDLYRAQRLPLLRLAVLLTDDPGVAEDVVQDAFVQMIGRFQDLRSPDSFQW